MLLILTIGTGTAGAKSNVQQGIVNAINHCSPRKFWLIPSSTGDSMAGAEMIRDCVDNPQAFQPWDSYSPFLSISNPDDLQGCLATVLKVIEQARTMLEPGEELVVNPTSGTKQMSAAATLAGLQMEVDSLSFISGRRENGVVVTHEEQVLSLPTAPFYARRAVVDACVLLAAGSATAAAQLLRPWQSTDQECADLEGAARTLAEWQRLDYEGARRAAAQCPLPAILPLRHYFSQLAKQQVASFEVVVDLIDSADALLHWQYPDEALARLYRATELSAKAILANECHLHEPYNRDELLSILPQRYRSDRLYNGSDTLQLGLAEAWGILDKLDRPEAALYMDRGSQPRNSSFRDIISSRNYGIYGHGCSSCDPKQVQLARDMLVSTLVSHKHVTSSFPRRRLQIIEELVSIHDSGRLRKRRLNPTLPTFS